jgi:hypothetical protein
MEGTTWSEGIEVGRAIAEIGCPERCCDRGRGESCLAESDSRSRISLRIGVDEQDSLPHRR